jgi:hypothetical protein
MPPLCLCSAFAVFGRGHQERLAHGAGLHARQGGHGEEVERGEQDGQLQEHLETRENMGV